MASIRAQLATAYAATLVCTVAVVSGLVYEVEREVQRQDTAHQLEIRARSDVDISLRLIEQAAAGGTAFQATAPVVVLAPGKPRAPAAPPGVAAPPGAARGAPPTGGTASDRERGIATLGKLLEGVPDYVVVLDSNGRMLYVSFPARQLDPDDQFELAQTAMRLPLNGRFVIAPSMTTQMIPTVLSILKIEH